MKKTFTLLLVVVCSFAYAQEYYYNGSEKVEVYPATDAFILFENETIGNNLKSRFTKSMSYSHKGYTLLEGKEIGFSMTQIMNEMPQHISAAYKLDSKGNFKMFPTKTVRVKLKSGKKEKDLLIALSDFDISEIEFKYGIFRIDIDDIRHVFKIANTIY